MCNLYANIATAEAMRRLFQVAPEQDRPIHAKGRMPVIIEAANYETWLTGDPDRASALIRTFPADKMRIVLQGVGEKADSGSND